MVRGSFSLRWAAGPLLLAALAWACEPAPEPEGIALPPCDPDDGGIALPAGFCALVVADGVGAARHLAVADNGDLFVALRNQRRRGGEIVPGGVVALRDTTGDGRADVEVRFGETGGSGIALRNGYLYFAPDDAVLRYPLAPGALEPSGPPDTIVAGLPAVRSHRTKVLAFDDQGGMYVNVGSPSNSCQVDDRGVESPGLEPCPDLETRAGIWRFDADTPGQTQDDGVRFATGLRNTVALTMHPTNGTLYGAVHGRDQLFQNWPALYDSVDGAEKPAEELFRIEEGTDGGWPYCYYDPELEEKVLSPEYGGDGREVARCVEKDDPIMAFPGHWAPNALLFYSGDHFPERYRGGAFIAFHGSWNRAPLPQGGYNVVFVPFQGPLPSGDWEVFAEGFPMVEPVTPRAAEHRPTGLAQGPHGTLFISDDSGGRIWRVIHREEGP